MAGHGFNNTMLAPLLSVLFITSDKLIHGYDFGRIMPKGTDNRN